MSTSDSYTLDNKVSEVMRLSDISDDTEVGLVNDNRPSFPFYTHDEFTDIALVVEGKELYTNKCLLAYASPVFACMFTSEFKEKNEKMITLPEKEFAAVCDMLSFLHPAVNFSMTTTVAFRVLPLAEEYQIHLLKAACEEHLLEDIRKDTYPNSTFLLKCVMFGEKCSLHKLLERAVDSLTDPNIPLKCIKDCPNISLETKAKIYEGKVEILEKRKDTLDSWKHKATIVKHRLKDIIAPHDDHCRCRVEVKLRNSLQRSCQYCCRQWCFDNISTEAYKNSYQFYCNHKIGYHIVHDAAIRSFLEQTDCI